MDKMVRETSRSGCQRLVVQENYLPEDIACLEKQMEFLRMTT